MAEQEEPMDEGKGQEPRSKGGELVDSCNLQSELQPSVITYRCFYV